MTYHVTPVNDIQEHAESVMCECCPKVEMEGEHLIVVHNAFDGRELIETMNENLN